MLHTYTTDTFALKLADGVDVFIEPLKFHCKLSATSTASFSSMTARISNLDKKKKGFNFNVK